jgi:hypothetical protein
MAKRLVTLEFFKSGDHLLAYRRYDDGSESGGRVTQEEAEQMTAELNEETDD